MDPVCGECGYDYRRLPPGDAASVLRREADALANAVRNRRPLEDVPAGSWSAIEYAGHVRDVLLVTRERTLHTRRRNGEAVATMAPDDRVAWGEYDGLTGTRAAVEIRQAAEWLAHTWELLADADWRRTLRYNYPEPTLRPLSWLAAHIVHEVVHHRLDIERLSIAVTAPPEGTERTGE